MTEQPGVRLSFVDVGPHTELNVFEVDGNSEAARQTPMFGRGRIDHLALQAASTSRVRHHPRPPRRARRHRRLRHQLRPDPEPVLPRSRRARGRSVRGQPRRQARRVQPAGHAGTRVRRRRLRVHWRRNRGSSRRRSTSARGSRSITTPPTSSSPPSTRRAPASPASRGRRRSTRRSASVGSTVCAAVSTRTATRFGSRPGVPRSIWSAKNIALPRARRRGSRRASRSTRVRRAQRRAHEPVLVRAGARRVRPCPDARVPAPTRRRGRSSSRNRRRTANRRRGGS